MRKDRVLPGEDLTTLAKRLRVPGCMLLRANRLYAPAWLTPGREIDVPEGDCCMRDRFACPVRAARTPACGQANRYVCQPGDTVRSIARALNIPERLVILAGPIRPGATLALPACRTQSGTVTVLPGERAADIAARAGVMEGALRRVNRLWGEPLPGMRLLIPEGDE